MHASHVFILVHAMKKKILRIFNFEKSTKNCKICKNVFLVHLSYKKLTLKTN